MSTRGEVVYAIVAMIQFRNVHSLFARRHLYRVVCALSTAEGVLNALCKHHAKTVVPKAVAYRETADEVRSRHRMALQLHRTILEVAYAGFIF